MNDLQFTNEHPTEAEIELFRYAGFYPIKRDFMDVNNQVQENLRCLKYAVIYPLTKSKDYPTILNVTQECIDYDSVITFDCSSESIAIKGYIDTHILQLVVDRTKELRWKYI